MLVCPGPTTDPPSKFSFFNKRGLHIIHLNVRSLLPKIDEVRLIAKQSNAACMCLSETWLDDSVFDTEISINNYSITRKDRSRHGGGVCMYIRNDIAFNTRSDLDHEELEATFVDILLPKTKPLLCGVFYRPPKQQNFYEVLESVLLSCSTFNLQKIYIFR